MAVQWEPSRRTGSGTGEQAAQPAPTGIVTDHTVAGRAPHGGPITRVDFFRRMPTGGGTAYFQPGNGSES